MKFVIAKVRLVGIPIRALLKSRAVRLSLGRLLEKLSAWPRRLQAANGVCQSPAISCLLSSKAEASECQTMDPMKSSSFSHDHKFSRRFC